MAGSTSKTGNLSKQQRPTTAVTMNNKERLQQRIVKSSRTLVQAK